MKTRLYLLSGLLFFTLFLGTTQAQEDPIIVQGNPPLTQSMVAKTLILLDWSLDIRLSDEQKMQIAQAVIGYWKTNNREEMNNTLEAVKVVDGLRQASPEERARAKEIIQAEILKGLRSDTNDEISQMVLKVFETTHSGNLSGPAQVNNPAAAATKNQRVGLDGFTGIHVARAIFPPPCLPFNSITLRFSRAGMFIGRCLPKGYFILTLESLRRLTLTSGGHTKFWGAKFEFRSAIIYVTSSLEKGTSLNSNPTRVAARSARTTNWQPATD